MTTFVYAVCHDCDVEGMFAENLICPNCGQKAEQYEFITAAELAALRARIAELKAALKETNYALRHLDNMTEMCPCCGTYGDHKDICAIEVALTHSAVALKGGES